MRVFLWPPLAYWPLALTVLLLVVVLVAVVAQRTRTDARERRRRLGLPPVAGRYVPPPASPWTPKRIVQGSGLERVS